MVFVNLQPPAWLRFHAQMGFQQNGRPVEVHWSIFSRIGNNHRFEKAMASVRPDLQVRITRVADGNHFRGIGPAGQTVEVDSVDEEPASAAGVSPLQLLVIALGTCSGVDLVSILTKGRQRIDQLDIEVSAQRDGGKPISLITDMHVHFDLEGELDSNKVERAVRLSLSTYCTVAALLSASVAIYASYSVNGERVDVVGVMDA